MTNLKSVLYYFNSIFKRKTTNKNKAINFIINNL